MKTGAERSVALLLAAHGERIAGAGNAGVARLAARLHARNLAPEIGVGFIKGTPTIGEAIDAFTAAEIIVYPLFLSDGYFTRIQLPRMLDEASRPSGRTIRLLPPLGLDPRLPDLVCETAAAVAAARGFDAAHVVLLAHGSRSDPASRIATGRLAAELRTRARFGAVRFALLEEPPSLCEATSDWSGPVVVLGLFAGDGMHGDADAHRLIAELGRADVVYAGSIGNCAGIDNLITAATARAGSGTGEPAAWDRPGVGRLARKLGV